MQARLIHRCLPFAALAGALLIFPGLCAAATIVVDTEFDVDLTNSVCSLREAIIAANTDAPYQDCPAGTGDDRIVFALTTPVTILLNASLPTITENLAIRGPGNDQLTIDGQDSFRPIEFEPTSSTQWLGLSDLRLANGATTPGDPHGGAVRIVDGGSALFERVRIVHSTADDAGGGIMISDAALTLIDCMVNNNTALGPGGGGGLATRGLGSTLEVIGSTFADNQTLDANGSGGGMLISRSTLILDRSTVSLNEAERSGGGISVQSTSAEPTTIVVRDSTITQNTAAVGLSIAGIGGGMALIASSPAHLSLTFENSVIADNTDLSAPFSPDLSCSSALTDLTQRTPNFVGDNDNCETLFPEGAPNLFGDVVGSPTAPLDPGLGVLALNGGETANHRPELGSLLIDQGTCPGARTDQRGRGDLGSGMRPVDDAGVANPPGGDGCDFGAVELGADPLTDPLIFTDGFELGHTLTWSDEVE